MAPHALVRGPVGLDVAIGIAPDAAGHAGPGLLAHELADLAAHRLATGVEHVHVHAERGPAERAHLDRLDRERREEAGSHLGAPGQVDDRDISAAGHLLQPPVRLRVPRLAGRAEDAKRREVVAPRPLVAVRLERADEGGRHAEHRHAVTFDGLP